MILDIIKYTDNNYKLKAKNINASKDNPFLQRLIFDMFDTIEKQGLSSLSAPQVGHNLNLFVISTRELKDVFINPEIKTNGLLYQIKETCPSFPNMTFPVNRLGGVEVKFFDKNWTLRYSKYEGNIAYMIQHEYDHLKGKLICE